MEYLNKIRSLIEENKKYPFIARRKGIEGKVLLIFTINKKGYLQNIKIEKSSGYAILDKAAIESVKKASPFPELPLKKERIIMKLSVCFDLK